MFEGQSAHAQYPGFDAPSNSVSGRGVAGLVPVESQVDGGTVPMGATAQVVVLFRNEGSQPVETGQINLYPSSTVSASVSLNQCSKEPLLSGAECAVAVAVKGLQPGSWRLEMLMLHSGRSRLVTATLSGSVDASGESSNTLSSDVEMIPDELDFGSLTSGQALVEPVILRNITSQKIFISEIAIESNPNSGFSVNEECLELEAGEACVATVTWAPRNKGPSSGVLVVHHSGPTSVASVTLSGQYEPETVATALLFPEAVPGKGLLVSSQDEFDFGDAVSAASTMTVSLVNTGDSPLTLEDIKVSGTNNGLNLSTSGCSAGLTLEPIEACPLTVTWSPTRVGKFLDDVQVIHDGARGVLVLPMRGTAEGTVSQDSKTIVLSEQQQEPTRIIQGNDVTEEISEKPKVHQKRVQKNDTGSTAPSIANASSALDGLRITSFSANRAIVNGPGGSRLLFNDEQVMLGGVVWDVHIQKNGIEFSSGVDRILLLFDRSLSSINLNSAQSASEITPSGE
ncbi:MAG: choice-of-anchor D domain-containing protein [Alphaproteobacteria bacterium]|nr:choice-of-anchor D domain-containing protein [Alphaproteobacteria bacterium]